MNFGRGSFPALCHTSTPSVMVENKHAWRHRCSDGSTSAWQHGANVWVRGDEHHSGAKATFCSDAEGKGSKAAPLFGGAQHAVRPAKWIAAAGTLASKMKEIDT